MAEGLPTGYGPCIDAAQLTTQLGADDVVSPTLAHAVNRNTPKNKKKERISNSWRAPLAALSVYAIEKFRNCGILPRDLPGYSGCPAHA
jgi:hypothetical protein